MPFGVPVRKAVCDKCNHVFPKRSKSVVLRSKKHKVQAARALQSSSEKKNSNEVSRKRMACKELAKLIMSVICVEKQINSIKH